MPKLNLSFHSSSANITRRPLRTWSRVSKFTVYKKFIYLEFLEIEKYQNDNCFTIQFQLSAILIAHFF